MPEFPLFVDLPGDFRWDEVASFHARQAQGVTVTVDAQGLAAGVWLAGHAAVLHLPRTSGGARLRGTVQAATALPTTAVTEAPQVAGRLLGLHLDPQPWVRLAAEHPWFASLVAARPGLRIPQVPDPFAALVWAITGQQITRVQASRLLARLVVAAAQGAASGLRPFPGPESLLALAPEAWRTAGYSRQKTATIIAVAHHVVAGTLALGELAIAPAAEAEIRLRAIPGIGPWTARYALLRGCGAADVVPSGDAVIQFQVGRRLSLGRKASEREVERALAGCAPWRSLAVAHLWAAADQPAA